MWKLNIIALATTVSLVGCTGSNSDGDRWVEALESVKNTTTMPAYPSNSLNRLNDARAVTGGGAASIGTGTFSRNSADGTAGGMLPSPTGSYTINLVDAPVASVAKAVLGDILHARYVVDPRVLVALVLVGLMSVLAFDVYGRLAFVRSLQRQYQLESDASAVARHIAGELEHALGRPPLADTGDEIHFMLGTADTIRFVAVARTGFDQGELRDITYKWSGPDGWLWRSTTPRRGSAEARQAAAQSEKLDLAIEAVSFSYLAESGEWRDDWPHSKLMPKAARVTIKGRGPRGSANPA